MTGLAFEARIAEGLGVAVVCGGGDAKRTGAALEAALASGANGIVSFGTAGGLAPQLAPGDWVVADAIVTEAERWPCDPAWAANLMKLLPGAMRALVAGAQEPIAGAVAKQALHQRTGAAAVDMESATAARVAAEYGLPLVACRGIVDPAHRSLPPAALVAMRPDGGVGIGEVFASLARQPGQMPQLLRLALDALGARRSLLRGRRMLGPGFGLPSFGLPDIL